MILDRLLRRISAREFVESYFHRVPYSEPSGAAALVALGGERAMRGVLSDADADVLIAREGALLDGERPGYEAFLGLQAEGWTLVARHAERHVAELAELADEFRRAFEAPVNVHLYATPGGRHGFGWHYDAEDVFIIQTGGRKTYALRKNTLNPWPLEETLPRDMHFERETSATLTCTLHAGDWLYLPAGYWHKAEAEGDELAVSLAVGVMSPTALDALDLLRPRLLRSLAMRQRLPVRGEASALDEAALEARFKELLDAVATELRFELTDPDARRELLEALARRARGEA